MMVLIHHPKLLQLYLMLSRSLFVFMLDIIKISSNCDFMSDRACAFYLFPTFLFLL